MFIIFLRSESGSPTDMILSTSQGDSSSDMSLSDIEEDVWSFSWIWSRSHLGGRRTSCFIRGPMNLGDGRNSHRERILVVPQSLFVENTRLVTHLNLGYWKLLLAFNEIPNDTCPILRSEKLEVIPWAYASDGTALKPAIEFDSRLKENIRLAIKVDLSYVKKKQPNSLHRMNSRKILLPKQ